MLPKTLEQKKNKGGRPRLDKVTVSIRLSRNVLAQVRKAASLGGNLSAWIEEAIKVQLNKDGIRWR